jgi:hypothetical protein
MIAHQIVEGVAMTTEERFKMPDDLTLFKIAVVVNDGVIERDKIADMMAMCKIILDRLYENGDVRTPSKDEREGITIID